MESLKTYSFETMFEKDLFSKFKKSFSIEEKEKMRLENIKNFDEIYSTAASLQATARINAEKIILTF